MAMTTTTTNNKNNSLRERLFVGAQTIFNLIRLNNLQAIRSYLTPLTLYNRNALITNQIIQGKSLLSYSCQFGFPKITKYFLEECKNGTETSQTFFRELKSSIIVAIQNLDFVTFFLLVSRYVPRIEKNLLDEIQTYALEKEYYSIVCFIKSCRLKLDEPPSLFDSNFRSVYLHNFFPFPHFGHISYEIRSFEFLRAASSGDLSKMKILLAAGVDLSYVNSEEENALCLAIFKDKKTEDFLIKSKVYTYKSYIDCLELCGAKFIVFRHNIQRGLECWRKSLEIRRSIGFGFEDKHRMILETELGLEFETGEQIDRLEQDVDGNVYIQALLVLLRLRSSLSPVVHAAFLIVAQLEDFENNLIQPLKILSELYEFPPVSQNVNCSPEIRAAETIKIIFKAHFFVNIQNKSDFMKRFQKLFKFLDGNTWGALLWGAPVLYRLAYGELLSIVVIFLHLMKSYDVSKEDRVWIQQNISEILQRWRYPYPTTLIHKVIYPNCSPSILTFLLESKGDPNCQDLLGNTPLHVVSLLPKDDPNLSRLTFLLINAGAHIDAANEQGARPLELLKAKNVFKNPLKYLSLQCLAAQVIHKNNIPIKKNGFPKILIKFIQLHSF